MDRLAAEGLRYNHFHTTALCSPTRAALITGRNHHSAAFAGITELATGYDGYTCILPKDCGTVGEVLRQNGYMTAWIGKNHNTPTWETSAAGPFDRWANGLGFDYFYGFNGGDMNHWNPILYENRNLVPASSDPDYHLTTDLAEKAIAWVRQAKSIAPDKPYFLYVAPGATHAPHQTPKDWIEKFKGKFDQGWDKQRERTLARQKELGVVPRDTKLTPRSAGIDAWDDLDADHKKVYARMMEVYAASLSYCDNQMGRVLDAIDETGDLDNTLVIYIQGDNGASAEGGQQGLLNEMSFYNATPEDFKDVLARMDELGGPTTSNHYPIGWAHAMNTPFQWAKQVASHFGGTRNGLVISWPARIKDRGGIRTQFHHIIDVAPTILEAVGVEAPSVLNGVPQKPIEGVSMVYSFDDAKAPSTHRTQYFEMFANRAIYNDGWIAATTPPLAPWAVGKTIGVDDYQWELYDLSRDFSEAKNLAGQEPRKLRELQELFWIEAAKYNVLPLDNSKIERLDGANRPSLTRGRSLFTYYPGMTRIPGGSAPDIKNKSFKIAAEVNVPDGGADGVLVTQGGRFNGWALYLLEGKPVFHYNLIGKYRSSVAAKEKLAPGNHVVVVDFKYDGPGMGKGGAVALAVDGKPAASGRLERTVPLLFSADETLDIGEDTGTPASEDYRVPFKFTGDLKKVMIELSDNKLTPAEEQEIKKAREAVGVTD